MHDYSQEEVEATLVEALRLMNETIDALASDDWIATLHPAGHLYEARLVTPDGVVVLTPEEKRRNKGIDPTRPSQERPPEILCDTSN
jgi:hypothetical protein